MLFNRKMSIFDTLPPAYDAIYITVLQPSPADCKNYSENSGLKFWVTNANKYPLLAPLAHDLLSAPASEAYVERVFSVCGELTAGKRNWLIKGLEKRIMLIHVSSCLLKQLPDHIVI